MGLANFLGDTCMLLTSESCTDAELFWERVHATSLLCVGVIVRLLLPMPNARKAILFLYPTIKPSRTIDQPYNLPISSTLHLGRLFSLLAD